MKTQLSLALGLAVIATPVLASKARLGALGEDNFGSYYINDNRNQFLNPARINEAKDLVTYEFGSSSTGAAVTADTAGTPKAEGGFNKSWNNMVWGLHFGNSTPSATAVRALVGGNSLQERNVWDFFLGGDAGIKWGANISYENFKNSAAGQANSLSSNSLRTRVGIISGDLDAFAQVSLVGDAKNYAGNSVDGKSSYFLGAGYMMNSYKLFADYLHIGTDYKSTVTTAGVEQDWMTNRIRVGAARQERLNDKTNLFAKLMAVHQKVDDDGGATALSAAGVAVKSNVTNITLPVVVGLEYDAASWLALRASVIQNVYGSQEFKAGGAKKKGTLVNTAVNAGASLKFGELTVDGLISTDADGNGANDINTNGGNGTLRTDALMSRVSMTYRF